MARAAVRGIPCTVVISVTRTRPYKVVYWEQSIPWKTLRARKKPRGKHLTF